MSRIAKTSTEVLKAALWMLENVGWIQHQGIKWEGEYPNSKAVGLCSSGAISHVMSESSTRHRAYLRLQSTLPKKFKRDIIHFNDHPKTTKKMVIAAFKRAIKGSK